MLLAEQTGRVGTTQVTSAAQQLAAHAGRAISGTAAWQHMVTASEMTQTTELADRDHRQVVDLQLCVPHCNWAAKQAACCLHTQLLI